MKYAFLILLAALLTACEKPSIALDDFPAPPPLTAQLRAPCPPLNQLRDNSIATLSREDSGSSILYAKCQETNAALVGSYDDIRNSMLQLIEKVKKLRK